MVAFYVTIVVLWIASFYWIFFRGGAEDLISHPGMLNVPLQKPFWVKAYFLAMLAVGIISLATMVFGEIKVPN